MTTKPATTRITATVTLDVHPKDGQSLEEAAADFAILFREYLVLDDFPFWEDYGATIEDIQAAKAEGEEPVWGGYPGPYVTSVNVRFNRALELRAKALAERVERV